MRTPPGLSVASERPWMIMPPCSVHSAKSPWHQTFGEALEIGGVVFRCRRGRSRSRPASTGTACVQTSSPLPSRDRLAVVVPDIDRHAEARRPGSRRARPARSGSPSTKQRDDVGAARDRGEMHVRLDRRHRRSRSLPATSGEPVEEISAHASRGRACRVGAQPGLAHRVDEFRRGAEAASSSRPAAKSNSTLPSGWNGEPS